MRAGGLWRRVATGVALFVLTFVGSFVGARTVHGWAILALWAVVTGVSVFASLIYRRWQRTQDRAQPGPRAGG